MDIGWQQVCAMASLGKYVEAGGHIFQVIGLTPEWRLVLESKGGMIGEAACNEVTPLLEVVQTVH